MSVFAKSTLGMLCFLILFTVSPLLGETITLENGIVFKKVGNQWEEYDANGGLVQRYRETQRNGTFIECHAIDKQMRIHIHGGDRIEWQQAGMANFALKGKIGPANKPVPNLGPKDKLVMSYLGHGYDATGEYADSRFRRNPIFVLNGRQDYLFRDLNGSVTVIRIQSGSNARSFSNSLSTNVEAGFNAGLFSTSVKVGVEKSSSGSNGTRFAQVDDRLLLYTARLNPSATVSPAALNELLSLPADSVFQFYGTHYINVAEFGGHLMWRTFLEESEGKESLKISTEIQAAYAGVSGSGSVNSTDEEAYKLMQQRSSLHVYGGGAALNANTRLNPNLYTSWKNAVPGNPALAGFGDDTVKDGLKPIWAVPGLEKYPNRVQDLKNALAKYIAKRTEGVFDKPSSVSPIVKKNSTFKLKSQDSRWLFNAESHFDGYYLTIRSKNVTQKNTMIHKFATNSEELKSGDVVQIHTTEKLSKPGYVCVPNNSDALYYRSMSGDYTNWKVWKGSLGVGQGQPIRFGDKIVLESVAYKGQVIAPSTENPGNLTTKKEHFSWTILQP